MDRGIEAASTGTWLQVAIQWIKVAFLFRKIGALRPALRVCSQLGRRGSCVQDFHEIEQALLNGAFEHLRIVNELTVRWGPNFLRDLFEALNETDRPKEMVDLVIGLSQGFRSSKPHFENCGPSLVASGSLLVRNLEGFPFRNLDSFSQEGEDLILKRILGGGPGFFVDIGAHDPFRFSNTAWLKEKGWSGINIEPDPVLYRNFLQLRPDDLNVNALVGPIGEVDFYVFEEKAYNTTDVARVEFLKHLGHKFSEVVKIPRLPLAQLMAEHVGARAIDLMNVDCEGADFSILQTNDWSRWSPKFLIVEILRGATEDLVTCAGSNPMVSYLNSKGYRALSALLNSWIFVKS